MARRRKRKHNYRKKSGVYATPAGFAPSVGGSRPSILAAAAVFMEQARANAAKFSVRIPANTAVEPFGELGAMVVTDGPSAPNAAPFEFGERHPLWGTWVTGKGRQPKRPYMQRAAQNKGTLAKAADIFGDLESSLLAEEYGYTE